MTSETAEQVQMFDLDLWSGKTSREPLVQTKEKISGLSLKKSSKSSPIAPLFLDLRSASGEMSVLSWETDSPLLGVYSTHSFGECPSVAVESHLSQTAGEAENCADTAVDGVKCLTPWDCQSKRVFDPDGSMSTYQAMGDGGANNVAVCYSFDSLASNSMKSSNPHSGCREVEVSKTLDTTDPNPSKNQGGIAIVQPTLCLNDQDGSVMSVSEDITGTLRAQEHGHQPAICIQGNCIDRADTAGCNGKGWRDDDVSFTLNTVDRPAVCAGFSYLAGSKSGGVGFQPECSPTLTANRNDAAVHLYDMTHADEVIRDCGEVSPTLKARMGTGGNNCPLTFANTGFGRIVESDIASTQCARQFKDSTDLCYQNYSVRRLTPLECERLQGFPDGWTDIGEWTDSKGKAHKTSDSARYKALGNSIALPPWRYVLSGVMEYCGGEKTMASLFDGIGGFPLIWRELGGNTVWASEIEEFPIAVTKKHFN